MEKGVDASEKKNMENTNLNISPIGMCIFVSKEIILNTNHRQKRLQGI